MTLWARRVMYTVATLVFVIVAPWVVATTAGYHWTGWRHGLAKTGVLVIKSQPRAHVLINGQERGFTPRRLSSLPPDRYLIELRRAGFSQWRQEIEIHANIAQVIGPVVLFPVNPAVVPLAASEWSEIVTDRDQRVIFGLRDEPPGWRLSQLWPKSPTWTAVVPGQPTSISVSPRQQLLIVQSEGQQIIINTNRNLPPWTTPAADDLAWTTESENIFFGRRADRIIRFDTFTQTETELDAADSLATVGNELWYTQPADAQTRLFRRPTAALSQAELIEVMTGQWQLQPTSTERLTIQEVATRQTELLQYSILTRTINRQGLGPVDEIFPTLAQESILWQTGVELYTRQDGQNILLERGPSDYHSVSWIVPGHILLTVDDQAVMIKSVSQRQGRGVLWHASLAANQSVLLVNTEQSRLAVRTDQASVEFWSWTAPADSATEPLPPGTLNQSGHARSSLIASVELPNGD
ncbi:MAG: PEGA domain-containing protein [Candidatus Kerfeldbacteria bacterium]|nr:PEGA domain-containing protein [Candidatus Kerfeldbacteria bacterium]